MNAEPLELPDALRQFIERAVVPALLDKLLREQDIESEEEEVKH